MAQEREALLAVLTAAIEAFTIEARAFYDQPGATEALRAANEAIHRLTGHTRAVLDCATPLTASRAAGIAEALMRLPAAALDRLVAHAVAASDWPPSP